VSALEIDRQEMEGGAGERLAETKTAAARRTRGGTSYQHSLSAKGIKSSGRARSRTDEDLLSSLKRLERAAGLPLLEDEEEGRRGSRAYGGRDGSRRGKTRPSSAGAEDRVSGPRFDW
jgi:hypothetical protein